MLPEEMKELMKKQKDKKKTQKGQDGDEEEDDAVGELAKRAIEAKKAEEEKLVTMAKRFQGNTFEAK